MLELEIFEKLKMGLYGLIVVSTFTEFSDYFIAFSVVCLIMIGMLVLYSVYGLSLQRCVCGCLVLLLVLSCYLTRTDDISLSNKFQDWSVIYPGFVSFYHLKNSLLLNNSLKNDSLGIFYKFCICFFSVIYFLAIGDSLKEQKLVSFDYLLVISLSILSLILMCNTNDLLTSYLTLELFSLASYILASFLKTSSYSIIAGIKYFITGSVASVFFLFGSSFIYVTTGSLNFLDVFDFYYFKRGGYVNVFPLISSEIREFYFNIVLKSALEYTVSQNYPYLIITKGSVLTEPENIRDTAVLALLLVTLQEANDREEILTLAREANLLCDFLKSMHLANHLMSIDSKIILKLGFCCHMTTTEHGFDLSDQKYTSDLMSSATPKEVLRSQLRLFRVLFISIFTIMDTDPFLNDSAGKLWSLIEVSKSQLNNPRLSEADALIVIKKNFIKLKEIYHQGRIKSNSNIEELEEVKAFIKRFSYIFINGFQPLYKKWEMFITLALLHQDCSHCLPPKLITFSSVG